MTPADTVRARVTSRPPPAILQLAQIEGQRMLRHPFLWVGFAATLNLGYQQSDELTPTAARYEGMVSFVIVLGLAISLVTAGAFAREHSAVGDDTPLGRAEVSIARMIGGLWLVAAAAALVAGTAILTQHIDLVTMGDAPGRTVQGYSLPELVQPVLLAAFAVALGAAVAHRLSSRLTAFILLLVCWYVVGFTYWAWDHNGFRLLKPLQVQPTSVQVGPATADPTSFPHDWVLSAPGLGQPGWNRLIVSPALAAWHDLYLLGLTILLVAAATSHPRLTRPALALGALLTAAGVYLQSLIAP